MPSQLKQSDRADALYLQVKEQAESLPEVVSVLPGSLRWAETNHSEPWQLSHHMHWRSGMSFLALVDTY